MTSGQNGENIHQIFWLSAKISINAISLKVSRGGHVLQFRRLIEGV